MPQDWVEPDIYLTHQDYVVYHTYQDDDYQQPCSPHWFSLQACSGYDDGQEEGVFDVRDLPKDVPAEFLPEEKDETARIIKYHIQARYFEDWERDVYDLPLPVDIPLASPVRIPRQLCVDIREFMSRALQGADLNASGDAREAGVEVYQSLCDLLQLPYST
jgi:hypothetical protein